MWDARVKCQGLWQLSKYRPPIRHPSSLYLPGSSLLFLNSILSGLNRSLGSGSDLCWSNVTFLLKQANRCSENTLRVVWEHSRTAGESYLILKPVTMTTVFNLYPTLLICHSPPNWACLKGISPKLKWKRRMLFAENLQRLVFYLLVNFVQ